MSNNMLAQMVCEALNSKDNQRRKLAEKALIDYRSSKPDEFFTQCADFLVDNNFENAFVKQAAGTLLVNSVKLRSANAQGMYLWDTLSQNAKQQVKQNMLNSLISSQPIIMKAGANVIAHIAVIEVPRKEWMEIVDILAENTMHTDVNVRRASTITIGFMCEVFGEAGVSIDERACEQFLGGIIIGCKQTVDKLIVQYSLKAMRDSLVFLRPILHQENYRNEVFKILFDNLKMNPEENIIYQALFQFSKACYEYLSTYLPMMIDIAISHIQMRNQLTIEALQLIDTIGTEYLQRTSEAQGRTNNSHANIQNYLTPIQGALLPEVMRCLLIENKNDLDFPEMRNSAAKTLSTLVLIGDRETIDTIAQGAATCLKSNQLGHQQASAVLISSLCQYHDKDAAGQIITDAFEPLLVLLNSQTDIVILNTLNGLSTIAEFYAHIFHNNTNLRSIVQKLFEFLEYKNANVVTASLALFKSMTQTMNSNCLLVTDPNLLLIRQVNYYQKYLDNYDIGQNKDFLQRSVVIIMNCLIKNKSRDVLLQMVDFLMGKYFSFSNRNSSDKEIKVTSVLSILHTSILALEGVVPRQGLVSSLSKLIDDHVSRAGIQQEGLNLISGMAVTFGKAFQDKAQNYWKILQQGLDMVNQTRIFRASLFAIGDFSRIYGDSYMTKQIEILNRLLFLIHQNLLRQTKISILACISDILLGVGSAAESCLDQILKMIDICFQAVYDLPNNPNERQMDEELKRGIIDLYACLCFAIYNGGVNPSKSNQLIEHFPFVATFIVRTCDKSLNPTIEYVKACMYVLFDSVAMYDRYKTGSTNCDNAKNILHSDPIINLVEMLKKFRNRNDMNDLFDLIQSRG